ncbi:hypothetical protein A3B21_02200 [Candidatus Uhrbacteria bacterium RIFCSPLOWO2_01_FULL_47_24]|uniref:Uncharacterized protein n=1 Tax=Candidatus Uhrbacteria bacterium RIFCSPLOWO2_01_FULL_47_24 TaxID=1802401 RepID=A0A1F7UPD1_9BACT|nr:MAG: hypothetical protein A3D58_00680 [Candidatus Uhrbacteria bacterium RIFCSPHIGHO2_02_FULL_46_47]OGL75446.1 MAG: hypothetical protein A3F52_05395 [Candidatus Uhrbacteria bacterium RIFCSPHIGHO2_12_FULL_47_11]OGL80163.1 MAG: hypothetical protein A3B21_02200 [Candidatus Uhrbacteria bacterium RIFCSPLOWO2_01_FULL_47_24]OGL84949.1 MAG: hypothetical protein A3J03_04585 [Candidatus Uhrbacteria bacterium RIFCSPLOWO2_02_FULL_46_25]OGL92333.1 MAG: hypothetical protein A3H11_02335 [Candidatus Uhrbacte
MAGRADAAQAGDQTARLDGEPGELSAAPAKLAPALLAHVLAHHDGHEREDQPRDEQLSDDLSHGKNPLSRVMTARHARSQACLLKTKSILETTMLHNITKLRLCQPLKGKENRIQRSVYK